LKYFFKNLQEFDVVTQDAKDFISGLLIKNHKARMTAVQCLKHPWLCYDDDVDDNLNQPRTSMTNPTLTTTSEGLLVAPPSETDLMAASGRRRKASCAPMNNRANLRRFLARRRWQRCGQAIRYFIFNLNACTNGDDYF